MKKILFMAMAICIGANAYNIENRITTESSSYQNRIGVLKVADECIKNAKNADDLQKCEQMVNENRKTHKQNRFDAKKENILADIDKRLRNYRKDNPKYIKLSGFRDCVVNANNSDELRICRSKK